MYLLHLHIITILYLGDCIYLWISGNDKLYLWMAESRSISALIHSRAQLVCLSNVHNRAIKRFNIPEYLGIGWAVDMLCMLLWIVCG